MNVRRWLCLSVIVLTGCSTAQHPPLRLAPKVDLERFMGDWYVIASIPTSVEANAHNAVESYRLDPDGTIATTFTFREGSFDGEIKRYTPRGYVLDRESNAIWGMQFIWPIKSDYRILYVSDDYTVTVIGRERRDYVWIMARWPMVQDTDYRRLLMLLKREGYDSRLVRRVPHRWLTSKPYAEN